MIFVDTSYWIATRILRDQWHDEAQNLWRAHNAGSLVTSNLVVGETWTYLRRRVGHLAAIDFLDSVAASPRVGMIRIPEILEREAWGWLRRHDERPYSFVDATSFVLMGETRIHEALAFDGDFSAAGFVELRA